MKIGNYTIYPVETSEFGLDGGAMFGIIPKPLWEKKAPADEMNRIEMVTRSMLLVSDEKKILIDTGNGTKWTEKFQKIYRIDTSRYNIQSSLLKLGISPDEITDVICTHLHFDHIGGNTKWENEKIVPVFPNADHWMPQENWDLANSPSEKDQGSFMELDWKVLAENQMIKLVKGDQPFLPGIDIIMTYGHTTGQMHPVISDGNQTIMYCGDLIPMAAHIPLPWVMAYDILPVLTVEEKRKILPKVVDENWVLFFEHDPLVRACTVEFDGKHYQMKGKINFNE